MPFNFNIDKSLANPFPDIELTPDGSKSFESSLLSVTGQDDSGMLFQSLQESLGVSQFSSPKGLLIPSSDASLHGLKRSSADSSANGPGGNKTTPSSISGGLGVKMLEGGSGSGDESTGQRRLLRKSTRLRGTREDEKVSVCVCNRRRPECGLPSLALCTRQSPIFAPLALSFERDKVLS